MFTLISLIPRPIPVKTDLISGELRVDGNIEENILQFRFRFTNTHETAPVRLTICAGGKIRRYYCTILENDPKEIITPAFNPEFSVGQCFSLIEIEPLVRFFKNRPKIESQFDK